MNIIVIGGGKVGYYLAKTLLEHGHKPIIIERDKDICKNVADNLDIPIIYGDGSTTNALENADISSADTLIAVTGKDEDNLIACQLAKRKYGIKKTVARVNNPKNKDIMKQLGVDIPVSGTDNIARAIEHEVDTAKIKQLMALDGGDVTLSEAILPDDFKYDGKRLVEIKIPEDSIIVSITRGENFIIPRGNTQIMSGDKIVVICKTESLHNFSKMLGL